MDSMTAIVWASCLVATALGQQPMIRSYGTGNLAIQLPVGASATVQYVDPQGNIVSTSPLVTQADLLAMQANFTAQLQAVQDNAASNSELLGQQIIALNSSKQNIVDADRALNALQLELQGALQSIGRLELQSGNLTNITTLQANCHAQGRIYNTTSQQCELALTISCGATVTPANTTNRVSGNCGGNHFYGDTCQAVCAPGFTGQEDTYQCDLDGQWRTTSTSLPPCVDTNECAAANNPCQQVCNNIPGGYRCSCNSGYLLNPDQRTCQSTNILPVTFPYIYNNYTRLYTVPTGTTRIAIAVYGSGGENRFNNAGGAGAYAEGTFNVRPGQVLLVTVGGPGTGYQQPANASLTNNYPHPSGGGLVGVFNGTRPLQSFALVIAGSGGGAGSNRARNGGDGGTVSFGGTATGIAGANINQCFGTGATANAGGRGGGTADVRGLSGRPLMGGRAGSYGAGGGAGYYGGGGGGHCPGLCGCGGGGGTSYVAPGATNVVVQAAGGSAPGAGGRVIIHAL